MTGLDAAFTGSRGNFALDAAITAASGSVTALFGPSGAGKTSLLRAIAGLERLAGSCRLDDVVWQEGARFVPSWRRSLGYVFQEASLFPHLSVRQNLVYGLRRAGRADVLDFDAAVGLLGLEPLLGRAPAHLSGGERQRVALGRALLAQPRLLLLDEPMSGLDAAAKAEILPYFEALLRRVKLPVVLVTHDIGEVERLADQVVLLRGGRVAATGPVGEMLTGDALGQRLGREAAAVLRATVIGFDPVDGLSRLDIGGAQVLVVGRPGAAGEKVRLRVAARDVSLAVAAPSASSILNVLHATIAVIEPAGEAEAVVRLMVGSQTLLARVTQRSVRLLELRPGLAVHAQVKGVSLLAVRS